MESLKRALEANITELTPNHARNKPVHHSRHSQDNRILHLWKNGLRKCEAPVKLGCENVRYGQCMGRIPRLYIMKLVQV